MPKKHKQMRMNTPTAKSIRSAESRRRGLMGGRKEPSEQGRKPDYSGYNAPFCRSPEKCGPVGRCLSEIACND